MARQVAKFQSAASSAVYYVIGDVCVRIFFNCIQTITHLICFISAVSLPGKYEFSHTCLLRFFVLCSQLQGLLFVHGETRVACMLQIFIPNHNQNWNLKDEAGRDENKTAWLVRAKNLKENRMMNDDYLLLVIVTDSCSCEGKWRTGRARSGRWTLWREGAAEGGENLCRLCEEKTEDSNACSRAVMQPAYVMSM